MHFVGFFLFIAIFMLSGCGKPSVDRWEKLVPETTLFIIVPQQESALTDVLSADYMPWFDDISPAAIQLVSSVQEHTETPIIVDALLLYPDTSNDFQPVWVTRRIDGLKAHLAGLYQKEFEQNSYNFKSHTIEKLFLADRTLYVIDIGEYTIFSESSLAIENILRTISRGGTPANLSGIDTGPGSVIFNTPSLDIWLKQVAQVAYRPFLTGAFDGTTPVSFRFDDGSEGNWTWQLHGNFGLDAGRSSLVRLISTGAEEFHLDRYVPVNAAAFSIFRSDPLRVNLDDIEPEGNADEYLLQNDRLIRDLRQHLGSEVAFISFANSGPASTSEYMFLRSLQNQAAVRELLDGLASNNLAIKNGNTYSITSHIIGKLLGSELNPATNYYVTVYDRVIALAQRNGLAESIVGDAERRRVMYYDDDYSRIRNSLPTPLSSIVYADASRFGEYVQPWLYTQNYLATLLANFDQAAITTSLGADGNSIDLKITNFERERTERPYREHWVFPLPDTDITGPPVLADITGSSRNEIIFSAENGSVYALASDGTAIIQMVTNGDTPIGQPVVYDWYGNNQNVIMQAAGNKIYAWNRNGEILPNFPVLLGEEITTPLTVGDITGNGVAEMVVATADRNVHILNARGQAISGWPQNTNSVVRSRPLVTELNGQLSIFVFAENALHGWNLNGQLRSGYPVFLSSQLNGSPVAHNNHLIGAGMDGNVYAVGTGPLFLDTYATVHQAGSVHIQSIPVSNSSLNSTPVVQDLMLRGDDGLYRDDIILLQASNGSLFLYNSTGELAFTQSLGQPSSSSFSPLIADINNDQRMDIIALADYGRLYAWDVLSADRHLELPTSGMTHPLIADFYGDGNKELIAMTRDGLVAWTIYFTRRQATSE